VRDGDVLLVAEIPDPACGVSPAYRPQSTAACSYFDAKIDSPMPKFEALDQSIPVAITGVPFFDFIHDARGGQVGYAPNGIEIHPVLIRSERKRNRVGGENACRSKLETP
jgi:hypothetical protein